MPVVALDIAGAEDGFPAEEHKEAYQLAHKHFMSKTVHAGESYGPESIFQAITGHFSCVYVRTSVGPLTTSTLCVSSLAALSL